MLGSAGFRDESLARSGAVDYGDDHFTCFQFGYDWRLDNADNARRLDDFIHRKKAYVEAQLRRRGIEREVRFDVVAHSMGALLTRYYLRYGRQPLPADGSLPQLTWAGARLVERAILVGPPNGGSLVVLERIVRGHKPGAFLPRYPPAVIGSFPSVYQLLPRSRHGAYVDAGHRRQLDLFDPALWQRLGWGLADPRQDEVLAWLLPDVGARNERRRLARAALARHLDRARRFHAALDRPATPPAGTTLVLVAGDAVPTAASIAIDLDGGDFEVASRAPGDGIVLRSSALMDERRISDWRATLRSPIAWHAVTFFFDDHLGLVRDPTFTDNVLYQLLEEPRRPFDDARREGQSDRLPGTVSRK
ncbi:MAG: hypothetical protein D6696_03080 [Acidobacteria bacterium]|nr:MAG: hypothetical protein D6696_03080 [Acidobacteriota bacterium]